MWIKCRILQVSAAHFVARPMDETRPKITQRISNWPGFELLHPLCDLGPVTNLPEAQKQKNIYLTGWLLRSERCLCTALTQGPGMW